jgi:hypothetical protein
MDMARPLATLLPAPGAAPAPDAGAFAAILAATARRLAEAGEGLPEQHAWLPHEDAEPGGAPPAPPTLLPAELPALPQPAGLAIPDAAALADLIAAFWMRERDRRTGEVRVSFGAAAWPATGARLERLPDGSIAISVSVDAHHGRQALDLDQLRRRLGERGLAVGPLDLTAG